VARFLYLCPCFFRRGSDGGEGSKEFSSSRDQRESSAPPNTEDFRSEVDSELDCESNDGGLHERLDLPAGVGAAESCRSAMSGNTSDWYGEFDRGDSCGSFEFLGGGGKGRRERRPSHLASDSIQEETGDDGLDGGGDDEDEDERLFFPRRANADGEDLPDGSRLPAARSAEEARILKQIQDLVGTTESGQSRKSSRSSGGSNGVGGGRRSAERGTGGSGSDMSGRRRSNEDEAKPVDIQRLNDLREECSPPKDSVNNEELYSQVRKK
jgi:hypothetical protein